MALLLGAFLAHGIAPGPKLLDTQLDITYTLIWTLALANVVGAGICFLSANPLARIATLRAGILIPTVFAVCFVGAFPGLAQLWRSGGAGGVRPRRLDR